MYTKYDLAEFEPADSQWTPVFHAVPRDQPVDPQVGGRYRVVFPYGGVTGFFQRACYSIAALGAQTVELRGYGRIFDRQELQFFAL